MWEKANQKLLSRSKLSTKYQKHQSKYPLSGKLYCKKHNCSYVRKIKHYKNKNDEIYWYCGNFHKIGRKDCAIPYVKEQFIYEILISTLKKYEIYKNEICEELIKLYNSHSKIEKSDKTKTELQNELIKLKSKKNRLLDLAIDGILNKKELITKKTIIENKINQINAELKKMERNNLKIQNQNNYNKNLKKHILKELTITKANIESYIEELLDKIIIEEKTETTNPNENFKIKLTL